ncbi:MAG: FliA/WhiG family RNA polymerase sigma factor [bacterium]
MAWEKNGMTDSEAADWHKFKEESDEEARRRLAEKYLSLVKWVVDRISYRLPPNVEREDLVSEGIIGLMDALDKFDTGRESRFESYAVTRIRGSVLDYLRQSDWVPRSLRQKCREIENAFSEIERQAGRSAEDKEVAKLLGISVDELHTTLADISGAAVISFEELLSVSDSSRPIPVLARVRDTSAEDPVSLVVKKEIKGILRDACEALPETEKTIIGLYYVERLTLKEIGKVLEVSESRVCQLHSRAILRLRAALTDEKKGES